MSEQLQAKQWVERLAPSLVSELEGKSPYEIQRFCMDYMLNTFKPSEAQKTLLQGCAYESGLEVEDALRVIAVELRDRLIAATQPTPDN